MRTRMILLAALCVALLSALFISTAEASPRVAYSQGLVCADANTQLCIGAPGLTHGGIVYSTDPAHARVLGFAGGAGSTHTLYFTGQQDLCLRAPGGNSLNVIIGYTTGDLGVDFTWQNAPSGGHWFYNPHTGLYLSITNHGDVLTVEAKGKPGWDQRFDGP